MIKCRVIVKINNDVYRYKGLFLSEFSAMMEATARFIEDGRVISVEKIND